MSEFGRELNNAFNDPGKFASNALSEAVNQIKEHPVQSAINGALLAGGAIALSKYIASGAAAGAADTAVARSAFGSMDSMTPAFASSEARSALLGEATGMRMSAMSSVDRLGATPFSNIDAMATQKIEMPASALVPRAESTFSVTSISEPTAFDSTAMRTTGRSFDQPGTHPAYAPGRIGEPAPLRLNGFHSIEMSRLPIDQAKSEALVDNLAQNNARIVPVKQLTARLNGYDAKLSLTADSQPRLYFDHSGQVSRIELPRFATAESKAETLASASFASLISEDPEAATAAARIMKPGLGFTTRMEEGTTNDTATILHQATSGSEAYVKGQTGNTYTGYLNSRFGEFTADDRATVHYMFNPVKQDAEAAAANGAEAMPHITGHEPSQH